MKALPERPRVLVITLRRLGDVLLTTPLIRSTKGALPAATIEPLVFAGTEGILSGNRALEVLQLGERLGIPALPEIVCPAADLRSGLIPAHPYAVVHGIPMYTYK